MAIFQPEVDTLVGDLFTENFRGTVYYNLNPEELIEHTLQNNMGLLTSTGALVIKTGKFTGRSPKDRYIVKDAITRFNVDWGEVNIPVTEEVFCELKSGIREYLDERDIFIQDLKIGADPEYQKNVKLVCEFPWSALFANNMFIRPLRKELGDFICDWTIICVPGYLADTAGTGLRSRNFSIINFSAKEIIIGGTGYTGEIKKSMFSVLNFVLPTEEDVFPMHCSANTGIRGDVALYFGLSGTGKTTLSSVHNRRLIGDDEHGWSPLGVFNFEGGCYAKTIDLDAKSEPEIFNAIRHGALLENVGFYKGTRRVDYSDDTITKNTRVSYPIHFIENHEYSSKGDIPKNIFFLTCDAYGVLPPVAKLDPDQAQYFFISGYTSKIAGTEDGIDDPVMTFSACFGAPFMPLHPGKYSKMLAERIEKCNVSVWLVNTGWIGGKYGIGNRIKLSYTRSIIESALDGSLKNAQCQQLPIFNLSYPNYCNDVPANILDPLKLWKDQDKYMDTLKLVAGKFKDNFQKYEKYVSKVVLAKGPEI